ncbi:OLC1v1014243C1 [Oldenlandia corymbosa var. corymbosa]|uniref:peptidyl-tRNA hydrolase n=1 Tax=Oldenlandia corymbosa var. corymbosa TaxID=529605 RepID=A0AAV1E0C1_OLDCO|nr:OLC1v1014243C1 [Oldenlandia corymbosa var. corymbosa]
MSIATAAAISTTIPITSSAAALRLLSSSSSSYSAHSKPLIPLYYSWTRSNWTSSSFTSSRIRMVDVSNQSNNPTPSAPEAPPDKPKPKPQPWLIVGLGNPGKLYSRTRHNVGFEMLDYIAEAEGISMSSVNFKACFGKGQIGDVPVMFAKPQTFMNASGESVGAIVSYYKIPLKQVLVIFDDMDLPFAKLRMLPKGGHGGHNGMKSIINHFKGSKDFPRLRIGIGRPPGKMNPASYVLRRFDKQESGEVIY